MFTQEQMSDFEYVRREFYRLWFYAYKCSQQARRAQKAGNEEEMQGAMAAFRTLSKQADEAYKVMDSMRPPRPAIIDIQDVAVEQDYRFVAPEIFLAEA